MLTQARLKELLHYDPASGLFTRLSSRGGFEVGSVAGSSDANGYIIIGVDYKHYPAHQLAYLYMTGHYSPVGIDHKDTKPNNNAWDNLRPATKHENACNSRTSKNNTTGFKGVAFHKNAKKYVAYITIHRKRRHLGCFDLPIEAARAYDTAAKEHFGAFARLNFPYELEFSDAADA